MKNTLLHLFAPIAAVSVVMLSSCRLNCARGSGNKITDSRKVSDFNKIDISGDFGDVKVRLKQDSSEMVTINTDDNLMKYIKTTADGDKLKIKTRKSLCSSGTTIITVGVKNLEELDASGAVQIISEGKIITKDLHFDLSGATKVEMELDAANVTTEGSGVTKMILKGQASSHSIDISGACKIQAFDFVVGTYNIETSGVSKVEVNVLNSLSVHTSGASKIEYRGNPSKVSDDRSGASSVKKVD